MSSTLMSFVNYLKRREVIPIIRVQTTLISTLERFMVSNGFLRLLPKLTSTLTDPLDPDPSGASSFIPRIKYDGQELALTQSMIFQKQLALISGLKRIFIMSPNIRFEPASRGFTGKHLFEFTQLDFEVAYADMHYIMDLVEKLLTYAIDTVIKDNAADLKLLNRNLKVPNRPFKVYSRDEMIDQYGVDWEQHASESHIEPFWVVSHRREFYDLRQPYDLGMYKNYDLIYPEGFGEALSGGEREYLYERIRNRILEDDLEPELFKDYLELARNGLLIPSAGAGLGVERLIRYVCGLRHIGDVQLFRRVPGECVLF